MQLVAALVSGIRGAENGQVLLYKRGTTTPTTPYQNYDGVGVFAQPIALDSFGGVEVYVNEETDIVVSDVNGVVIRSFSEMLSANSLEYVGQSFTGARYSDGLAGIQEPVTLQAILDAWVTSAGAIDFKVLFAGAATRLQDALGGIAGLFFNVKAPAYGAVGDNVTDDTTAIQSAMTAAGATKGIVIFPPGTYRTTDKLSLPDGVSLWGMGPASSIILLDHPTRDTIECAAGASSQEIRNLGIATKQANNGKLLSMTVAGARTIRVYGCAFADINHSGDVIVMAGAANLLLDTCIINLKTSGGISADVAGARLDMRNCTVAAIPGAYNGQFVIFNLGTIEDCVFAGSGISAGTYTEVIASGLVQAPHCVVAGCLFYPGSGTSTPIVGAAINYATTTFAEYGNGLIAGFTNPYISLTSPTFGTQSVNSLTRDSLIQQVTSDAASVNIKGGEYGMVVLTRTAAGAGNQALVTDLGPLGTHLTIVVYNNSGGALAGDFTFTGGGSGFYSGTPNLTKPANGKISIAHFRCAFSAGTASYVPVGTFITNI